MRATDGLAASGMFQAICGDAVKLVTLKSLARFDKSTGNQPFKYLLHFFGPPMEGMPLIARILLALLMLPIELVSHFARLLSLTVRLWANIFAGDLITLVFFSMIPIGIPIIFSGLHIVVAVLQAYVFMLLSIIYVSGAVADEH